MIQTTNQESFKMSDTKKAPEKGTGPRTVYLRAKPLGGYLPKEVQAESVRKLSSVFQGRQPLRPFTPAEEKRFLHGVLEVSPDDRDWDKHTRRFWAELRIPVPFAGVPLQVGTDADGVPYELLDYIKYRFAIVHPLVAKDETELVSKMTKWFYILDPDKEVLVKNNKVQVSKQADKSFILLSEDEDKMKEVLQLMLGRTRVDIGMTPLDIENALFDQKSKNPQKFLDIVGDPDLGPRAEIGRMIAAGVIIQSGTTYTHRTETLASSEDELIAFFKNPKHTSAINALRGHYRETLR